jgi:acid phosphatase (class A)
MKKTSTTLLFLGVLALGVLVLLGIGWYQEYLSAREDAQHAQVDASAIMVPPPPADDTQETQADLKRIQEFAAMRTQEDTEAIAAQTPVTHALFGAQTIEQYMDKKTFPHLRLVLRYTIPELERIVDLKQKEFNRARPSEADSSINPIGGTPTTPGYPAHDAAVARLVGLIFSDLDTAHRMQYMGRASEIADHEERAGLQYSFDNLAGALVADEFYKIVTNDPEFMKRFAGAKDEASALASEDWEAETP